MLSFRQVGGLTAALGLLAATATACGGGGSSSTGPSTGGGSGGSGAVVQGQIRAKTTAIGESAVAVALQRVLGIGVAEAQAGAAVPDGTVVRLVAAGQGVTLQTSTTGGAFAFTNVLPGQYTIEVVGFTIVSGPTTFFVGAGDLANISGTASRDQVTLDNVHVAAAQTEVQGILQSDAQVGHLINLAVAAGVPADQVLALRLRGMGWGQIAHALGVHPGSIGLGHEPGQGQINAFKASHGKGKGKKKGQA
ncbi:MAG TPA: hypothetical protein VHF87_14980 [Methylomirabilota bacterium]|jgi:hypothetical protein|nr:hypothetical protein [Methylomirabilota bacterium]